MLTFKYVYDSQSSTKLRDQLTEMAGVLLQFRNLRYKPLQGA